MTSTSLQAVLPSVQQALCNFAQSDHFWADWRTAFGTDYDVVATSRLREEWKRGEFTLLPTIRVLTGGELGAASGAFAADTNTIYLADSFLRTASSSAVSAVILEEIGHYLDQRVNKSDRAGDEGAIFAQLALGQQLNRQQLQLLQQEDDTAVVQIDGQPVSVELSGLNTTALNGTTVTPTSLVNTLVGSGITVSGVTFTGATIAAGTFTGGLSAGLAFDAGIMLSSGDINLAKGPNNLNNATKDNNQPGDVDLGKLIPQPTLDAAVL